MRSMLARLAQVVATAAALTAFTLTFAQEASAGTPSAATGDTTVASTVTSTDPSELPETNWPWG